LAARCRPQRARARPRRRDARELGRRRAAVDAASLARDRRSTWSRWSGRAGRERELGVLASSTRAPRTRARARSGGDGGRGERIGRPGGRGGAVDQEHAGEHDRGGDDRRAGELVRSRSAASLCRAVADVSARSPSTTAAAIGGEVM
jgi:hypothetical protein